MLRYDEKEEDEVESARGSHVRGMGLSERQATNQTWLDDASLVQRCTSTVHPLFPSVKECSNYARFSLPCLVTHCIEVGLETCRKYNVESHRYSHSPRSNTICPYLTSPIRAQPLSTAETASISVSRAVAAHCKSCQSLVSVVRFQTSHDLASKR